MIPPYLVSFDTNNIPEMECDVLVAGSGVAGLSAALELSCFCRVLIVTKSELLASTTRYAQGGIAAVIDEHDSPASHAQDTLVAGCGICDAEAVGVLVNEGSDRVLELLDRYETGFDMKEGKLELAMEGGHSHRRVVHAKGDATGYEVEMALGRALEAQGKVEVMEHGFLVDLLLDDGSCRGALLWDSLRNRLLVVGAKAVVMATGGMGQLYLVTTNPLICTGDGIAMAFRAGARVSDVEFVQFHPTALHIPEEPKFLISEALRGEGAVLVDSEGSRIMEGIHPLADLAPRDVVVSRMVEVMKEEEKNHLYLDVSHLDPGMLRERFPAIHEHCLQAGIDITRHRIPVSPAAHYMSGGVVTDLDGQTDVPGLFACGEVACTGVHGANRLASNSLLEGLVFARRLSRYIKGTIGEPAHPCRPSERYSRSWSERKSSTDLLRGTLREYMRDSAGMVRCEKGLREALEFLRENAAVLEMECDGARSMELKNMITVALLVARAAQVRLESRGCHRRRDYPEPDDWSWRKHTDMKLVDGEISCEARQLPKRPVSAGAYAKDTG